MIVLLLCVCVCVRVRASLFISLISFSQCLLSPICRLLCVCVCVCVCVRNTGQGPENASADNVAGWSSDQVRGYVYVCVCVYPRCASRPSPPCISAPCLLACAHGGV